jgi:osmotically-inducible protein OsmY
MPPIDPMPPLTPPQEDLPVSADDELKQAVFAQINLERSLDKAQIGVDVDDGIVTLQGAVSDEATRSDAVRAAWRVPGVKGLCVALVVSPPSTTA